MPSVCIDIVVCFEVLEGPSEALGFSCGHLAVLGHQPMRHVVLRLEAYLDPVLRQEKLDNVRVGLVERVNLSYKWPDAAGLALLVVHAIVCAHAEPELLARIKAQAEDVRVPNAAFDYV